jgi:hypothetical protein
VTDFTERQRFVRPDERNVELIKLVRNEQRRATLCVATHGKSVDDVRLLLDVLGLDPELSDDVVATSPVTVVRHSVAWNDPGRTDVRKRGKK